MTVLFSLSIVAICYLLNLYSNQKRVLESYRENALYAFSSHEDMKETLRIGLYNRFKRDFDQEKDEDPLLFEHFVADIIKTVRSGSTYVTRGSGDFGVDIEERTDNSLFLGQVKCYNDQNLVGFSPIAIIHSQMVKQDAVGGYVVTTSDFTPNARAYAQGLNIDLINGRQLVELWLDHLNAKSERIEVVKAEPQLN
ncbi:restriction endonuclease [Paenibacillus tianjinensis]|uniref:Restriction endonuclease n=1 Tax=Paenibacillus tianjinensis TaxID=2810347 RepID=A0ABX7LGH4_9BACL|nr:restriction endonuclease [Paenibacillus tianjinensis]QSF46541.1 restriction endonuclease [Paenibacillus tianjinensis]